jgi:type I restriction enzyme S subunit
VSVMPFGRVVRVVTRKSKGSGFKLGLEAIESGTGRLIQGDFEYDGEGVAFEAGDVLFGKLRPYLAKAWLADRSGDAVGDFHVYRVDQKTAVPEYVRYALLSRSFLDPVESSVFGTKMPRANWQFIRNVSVYMPSLDEQRSVAAYLEYETAQIDALIQKQQRLVDMLRERRAAVVEIAIAHLDWSTPVRAVVRLIQTGPFGSQLKSEEYVPGGTPVINPSHLVNGLVRPSAAVAVDDDKAEELSRHALLLGDVVAARRGELGRCAVVEADAVGYLCGTGSALIRPKADRVDSRFFALCFSSRRSREALALASVGSTMDNLNAGIIAAIRIPVPSIEVQQSTLAAIDDQTSKIDALIAKAERFIELARERRSALITAATTGQIDVRGEVA